VAIIVEINLTDMDLIATGITAAIVQILGIYASFARN